MTSNQKITPFLNEKDFVQNAITLFHNQYQNAIEQFDNFVIAFSGGTTPIPFFETLATPKIASLFDWNKIHIFWVDERVVPNHSPENNFNNAYQLLLRKVHLPYENKHRITTYKEPTIIASEYEQEIKEFFINYRNFKKNEIPKFDLIFLGMGLDGHTASLFPNSDTLTITNKLIINTTKPNTDQKRITMTFPLLENAQTLCVMAQGKEKISLLNKVFNNESIHLPIAILKKKHPTIHWMLQD